MKASTNILWLYKKALIIAHLVLITILSTNYIFGQDTRLEIDKTIKTPIPHTPGEWEPHSHLIMKWNDIDANFNYNLVQMKIIKRIQNNTNNQIILLTHNEQRLLEILADHRIPTDQLMIVYFPEIDYVWVRDYAPQTRYVAGIPSLVKWQWVKREQRENFIGRYLQKATGYPLVEHWLIGDIFKLSGGNFMTDGFGTSFHHKQIRHDNITPPNHREMLKKLHWNRPALAIPGYCGTPNPTYRLLVAIHR